MNKVYFVVGKLIVNYVIIKFTEGIIDGIIDMNKDKKSEKDESK